MRFITFFALTSILATTSSRPIANRREVTLETTSLDGDVPSSTTLGVVASATDISSDLSTIPTSTSDPLVTNSSDSVSATATDTPTSVASSADPTDLSSSVTLFSVSATPTASTNETDVSATATDDSDSFTASASATATPSSSITFIIPTAPAACLAKFTDPSLTPSSTSSADFSQNTTSVEPSSTVTSDNSTVTDTASLSIDAIPTSTDSLSGSASATASVSASGSDVESSVSASVSASGTATASGSAASSTASASATSTASGSENSDLPEPAGTLPVISFNPDVKKRIAQEDLPDVAQSWQDLCLISGGDIFTSEPCVILAGINGINALLANADPCDQQDNADAMIDFAKSPGVTNTDELIANAVAYRQHARNALNIEGIIPSTPYCQKAPRNDELVGVVNEQLVGVNPGIFGGPTFGLVAFGDPSTCPFGTSPNPDTCDCE